VWKKIARSPWKTAICFRMYSQPERNVTNGPASALTSGSGASESDTHSPLLTRLPPLKAASELPLPWYLFSCSASSGPLFAAAMCAEGNCCRVHLGLDSMAFDRPHVASPSQCAFFLLSVCRNAMRHVLSAARAIPEEHDMCPFGRMRTKENRREKVEPK